ncbi:MFS transporter, partial [Achromobacter sp. SIMBA_011]|uniref:MFS transporter n=1 Tax=Achromobacter sp. SIMBA_011 TaxID=3085759 RepID=UPI00397E08FC
ARYRGTLSTLQQVAIIFGLFCAFVSNYFLADTAGGSTKLFWLGYETWRWMFWVELLPASLFLIALLFIPESPRYLMMVGRKELAVRVLTNLYGQETALIKRDEIEASLATDKHQPKLSDLIDKSKNKLRPIVWVGIGL